ncbi:DNA polymerase III subunit epsilon [Kordiimonas sp. SCSIO 12610]|uniref:DNA polymerase III subunit epsilon n=1 Tax=Kordiimonas sp. SCSIO 12610 TaxID=2829597 RepID=UPI002108766D|nr:DNA polymerase III subunit epsilon [Kordiimonas sp. SCSIO 12610]UTW55467.1 DNA polymerase III subunit epsilon [Kordiimonas sp. SCSIO 12610]
MREIVFDTETTGFDPLSGDRLIEIGCLEMVDMRLTETKPFHIYINPEREVPESAVKVHGLTTEFLKDKQLFAEIAQDFLDFVGDDSVLVAHNAEFDMKFINFELEKAGYPIIPAKRFKDTLAIARTKFPGQANSLDALCKRFGVENGHRTLHGALLDSEILADVYIELMGGRQAGLDLAVEKKAYAFVGEKKERPKRSFAVSEDELQTHKDFVQKLSDPIWGA